MFLQIMTFAKISSQGLGSRTVRELSPGSADELIRRLVQMRVRRVDGFPRRIGNWSNRRFPDARSGFEPF